VRLGGGGGGGGSAGPSFGDPAKASKSCDGRQTREGDRSGLGMAAISARLARRGGECWGLAAALAAAEALVFGKSPDNIPADLVINSTVALIVIHSWGQSLIITASSSSPSSPKSPLAASPSEQSLVGADKGNDSCTSRQYRSNGSTASSVAPLAFKFSKVSAICLRFDLFVPCMFLIELLMRCSHSRR